MSPRGYLVDTNVISELRKPRPNPSVLEWVEARSDDPLFISVITVGETPRQRLIALSRSRHAMLSTFKLPTCRSSIPSDR